LNALGYIGLNTSVNVTPDLWTRVNLYYFYSRVTHECNPYNTKRQHLINEKIGNLKTVGNYLIALEENGFLKSVKVGKEKLYLNQQLLKILENKE
jgi:hypothetical protein